MYKLTVSLAIAATALMTLIVGDASAATIARKATTATAQSETMTTPKATFAPYNPIMRKDISAAASRGSAVSLNPQPLPPRWNPAAKVSLNPQPLPPGPSDRMLTVNSFNNRVSAVALNPQPLPPKAITAVSFNRLSVR